MVGGLGRKRRRKGECGRDEVEYPTIYVNMKGGKNGTVSIEDEFFFTLINDIEDVPTGRSAGS